MTKRASINPADPILGAFQEKMRRELLKSIIGRLIFCPRTGEVLDVRTAVVFVDSDGDPHYAMSQRGWREVIDTTGYVAVEKLAKVGTFLDRSSVKPQWYLNEEGEPYKYDPTTQAHDFPNDPTTAYPTKAAAKAAALGAPAGVTSH